MAGLFQNNISSNISLDLFARRYVFFIHICDIGKADGLHVFIYIHVLKDSKAPASSIGHRDIIHHKKNLHFHLASLTYIML